MIAETNAKRLHINKPDEKYFWWGI